MPLYEYACHLCGKTFEVIQKFSDEPLTAHEGCGGELERLISAPALQFKGTGWYVTDYARNGKSGANGSNGKTESKPPETTKSEPKSESKPGTSSSPSSPTGTK